ncbi:MAG TPA: TraR/DksA C4-type zinc finger protein [Pyrinomonadaceae bacterium]|nr:TraR/DksA C4-type zinc finger protein [Pyrinomonadaceae bacterium]
MVSNATLLQTFETLSDPPLVSRSGEIWQRLQDERLEVSDSLLNEGRRFIKSSDAAEEFSWRHRERLERRLRQLTDAQDRLLEGRYGRCLECDELITERRLAADPAAALCYECQRATDRKQRFYSL